jgi:Ni,Fe-hydrogenase III component G
MTKEEVVLKELTDWMPAIKDVTRVQRIRRVWTVVSYKDFEKLLCYARDVSGFGILLTITGVDDGETLGFLYHLTRQDGTILTIKTSVPKAAPVINTVGRYFPSAEIYERELIDLIGAKVEGLPPGKKYPLPDDWPEGEYPLRKDWQMTDKSRNCGRM